MVQSLLERGFPFDRNERGGVCLGKEGAHSYNRIFHAGGDATGRLLIDYLLKRINSKIKLIENEMAADLLIEDGRCIGVMTKDSKGRLKVRHADEVVLAAGGCGNLFLHHTNDPTVTGDGLSLAYRAGAELTDLEFTQFHPTLLVKMVFPTGLFQKLSEGKADV